MYVSYIVDMMRNVLIYDLSCFGISAAQASFEVQSQNTPDMTTLIIIVAIVSVLSAIVIVVLLVRLIRNKQKQSKYIGFVLCFLV